MRGRGLAQLTATACLLGAAACATTPLVYGPIGEKMAYGYSDRQNPDGSYSVLVAMPAHTSLEGARVWWDRRAEELCPGGVARRNIFRAERRDSVYMAYGTTASAAMRTWISSTLEGYVYCKSQGASATDAAEPETAPPPS